MFFDSQTGWATGGHLSSQIVFTDDGGGNWVTQYTGGFFEGLYDVYFIDALHGWVVGDNKILTTNDGGTTWVEDYFYVSGNAVLSSIFMLSYELGWIAGSEDGWLTGIILNKNVSGTVGFQEYRINPDKMP
ncbi:MAG: hypothetical protein K8R58_12985 [Bacteroidales bacterium]|nr:hypothetical protein [Bacteroidales bacterium]